MNAELKPCPFCGSEKHMLLSPTCYRSTPYNPADRAFPIIRCGGCYTDVPGKDFDATGRSAVEAWNQRAVPSSAEEAVPNDVIGYVMRYGGMCRDCADEDGTCPTSGQPCDTNQRRAVVKHTIAALAYGIKHDFIANPFIAALSSAEEKAVEVPDLDARMKAAGMYTIAEMMGVTPMTKWKSNPAINTLDAFSEWLDRKVSEYLTMKAGYDLGDKSTDDELYEWVEAHAAVYGTIRDQFQVVRSALVDVPAVESEPVAKPDWWQDEDAAEREFTEYFVRNYPGPDTIIHDPNWHAPKLFRAARLALLATRVPTPPSPYGGDNGGDSATGTTGGEQP